MAASCRNLAFLHKVSSSIEEIPFENLKTETTSHLFERKNRELRSIRKFIGKVRGKNDFELLYMDCFDSFYKEASHALAHLLKAEADLANAFFETGISGYSIYRHLTEKDFLFLYLLFLYPEKFWKISNQYYNHRKSWIPPRTLEKLQKVLAQNEERHSFLKQFADFLRTLNINLL